MDLILPNSGDDNFQQWPKSGRRCSKAGNSSKMTLVARKIGKIANEKKDKIMGGEARELAASKMRRIQPRQLLRRFVPITQWFPRYRWQQSFFVDLCAGLTAAVFSIPTGIAHAGICGVAPVYGLYTVIFPTFFYMFFGHSRHNALGGFAILSLMTRAAIERVDRMLVNNIAISGNLTLNSSNFTAGNYSNSTMAMNFSMPIPISSTNLPTNPEEMAIYNQTIALMNNTQIEGEDELLNTVVDESTLNTSLIIAELNVSADDELSTTSSNPLLNDPIQLSVAKTPVNNSTGNGLMSEMGKRMRDIRPIHIATLILFLSGVFQILMGIFRLDFLSCYFSEQVMSGFVLGGCVHVFFSQIGDLLGIQQLLPSRSGQGYLYNRILDIYAHLAFTNAQTLLISICSIFFLLFTQQIFEPWLADAFEFPMPYELLLVIIGITATNFADLSNRHNITVVGNIPTNFPPPSIPRFELVPFVLFDAVSIAVTAVAIHLTVVKIVENRYHYKINSCQELYSLGLSGLCSSAFPVFPITSIFARTLIGDANANSTQMTICFSSLSLLTVILYIGPALEYLPKCILASIVIVSVCSSFNKFGELRDLWPLFKIDFAIFLVSFLLTVCYDIAEGLALSAMFSAFTIVVRDQWPKWHFLGHDKELNEYKEVPKQFLQQVADEGHAFIIRYDAPLIFTSVHKFMKVLLQSVKRWDQMALCKKCSTSSELAQEMNKNNNTLIIDCSGFPYVDYLGLRTLNKVYKEFSEQNVIVKFAAPKVHLMRMFRETDFFDSVPEENVFQTVKQAVNSCSHPASMGSMEAKLKLDLLDSDEEQQTTEIGNNFY